MSIFFYQALRCPPNSYFTTCVSTCEEDCFSYLNPSNEECEEGNCIEGCVCNEGYVRSGDQCVLPTECGCSKGGKYYKVTHLICINRNLLITYLFRTKVLL